MKRALELQQITAEKPSALTFKTLLIDLIHFYGERKRVLRNSRTIGILAAAIGLLGISFFGFVHTNPSTTFAQAAKKSSGEQRDWPVYGGSPADMRYSTLAQINRSNVRNLQVAWTFDSGEIGGLQTSPIIVDGMLFAYTPTQKVFALDAATGKLIWKFDSGIIGRQPDRGLATWTDGKQRRILAGIMNYVYALDAATGKPIASFGENGRIDLRENLGRDPKSVNFALTSPGIVFKDLLIVGGRLPETLPCAPGNIRAYDVKTGQMRWSFHTIPHPGELGYETWPAGAWKYTGAANNWAGMAVDTERGIVYVPTGSASSDFYGADRYGDDLFANCLIALDANTGKRLWHFQGVKHDLWDRDFPAPPVLVTVTREGKPVDAVAETSKQGYVFLFNRVTGEPLFPIEYHAFPQTNVPGEYSAATQPLPTKPAPYARQLLTEDMVTNRTPEAHKAALEQFHKLRSEGQFVPFSVGKDTVVFPWFDGGGEWGGPAVDPETKILYVNSNDVVGYGAVEENTSKDPTGRHVYMNQCAICHRDDLSGSPPDFPSLKDVGSRLTQKQIGEIIRQGRGRMPGFTSFPESYVVALEHFLTGVVDTREMTNTGDAPPAKYRFAGYGKFLDIDGYPAVVPPWGTLNAINLDTGEYVWKIPFGEYPALVAQGLRNTGTENYGGPIVTAGGLLFIGATNFDKKFHVYDKATGELLWETTLPFAGNATPATYEIDGRQFVVIAAGGGKDLKSPSGGKYVAFALSQ
jgi:quinoprotein glucose dehydrogenase